VFKAASRQGHSLQCCCFVDTDHSSSHSTRSQCDYRQPADQVGTRQRCVSACVWIPMAAQTCRTSACDKDIIHFDHWTISFVNKLMNSDHMVRLPLFRDQISNCTNMFRPELNRTSHRVFAFVGLPFGNL